LDETGDWERVQQTAKDLLTNGTGAERQRVAGADGATAVVDMLAEVVGQ
jgi:hypothetical protein